MGIIYEAPNKKVKAQRALLIGIERFDDPAVSNLAGVKSDLDKFNKLLSNPSFSNFSVTKIANKKTREVKKSISLVCEQADEDDVIFFFYAGHGLVDQDRSYFLLCTDSEGGYLDATCIEADFVLSQFRKSKCHNFIVIVDSCYSGAFFNNNRGIPNGLVALTACNEHELALETSEGGMFSNIIINGLRSEYVDADRDGKITFSELFDYITAQFEIQAPESGTPRKWEWNGMFMKTSAWSILPGLFSLATSAARQSSSIDYPKR